MNNEENVVPNLSPIKEFQNSTEYKKLIKVSGLKKIENYIWGLFEDDEFLKDVEILRTKLKIDVNSSGEIDVKLRDDLHTNIEILLIRYGLDITLMNMILPFVLFNDKNYRGYYNQEEYFFGSLFMLEHANEINNRPPRADFSYRNDIVYPISIRISPHASQRDIIEYVKSVYGDTIKPLQERYIVKKAKMEKFRTRKDYVKKRNGFIIEHKHLKPKEIKSLLASQLNEYVDQSYIAKILRQDKLKQIGK